MKYLYRILRLFFCPHKYELVKTRTIYSARDGSDKGYFYIKDCKYCGKTKSFKVTV